MKNATRTAFCFLLAICVGMLAVPFSARAAGTPYIEENGISPWRAKSFGGLRGGAAFADL
jgi:hypothetical protein